MTMQKVRVRALKKAHRVMLKNLSRRHRSRTEAAINSHWSLREQPDSVLDMKCECVCLRAQITAATIREKGDISLRTSQLIARNARRINQLAALLKKRILHG